jgi:sarcosine oxidase subunit gamma
MAERHSPLAPLAEALAAGSSDAVALREIRFVAQVDVRADADGASALGLPLEPNTTADRGERTLLCLGPDEWLAVGPDGDAPALAAELEAAGAGWVTTVDLSSNRTVLELTGPLAREVLAKGCTLDLHPRAFGPGRCAQTALARAQVILEARDDGFRIYVRGSFATYLATWLLDAMAEYGRGVVAAPQLVEDDRPVGVHEDAVLQMPPHGA